MSTTDSEKPKNEKKKFQILVTDPARCVGCEVCESVCSMVHDGEFNPINSRINRVRIEPIINSAFNCSSCNTPDCVKVCKPKALTKSKETGLIIVDESVCDGCGICVRNCPWGAINVHTKKNKAITCDMCSSIEEGTPQCVVYCPKDAIFIKEIDADSEEDSLTIIARLIKEGFGPIEYEEGSIIKRSPDLN